MKTSNEIIRMAEALNAENQRRHEANSVGKLPHNREVRTLSNENENGCRHVEIVFQNNKGPKWLRTVFYDFDVDDIFIPAEFLMSEMIVLVALAYDATRFIVNKNHIYIPLKWTEKETKDRERLKQLKALDKKIRGELKPWEEYD